MTTLNNPATVLRAYLVTQAGITSTFGSRVYAQTDTPPPGYDPGDGAALCFAVRGGSDSYDDEAQRVRFQFAVYGTGATYSAQRISADAGAIALHHAMQNAKGSDLLHATRETLPQPLDAPGVGWPMSLVFYIVFILNND